MNSKLKAKVEAAGALRRAAKLLVDAQAIHDICNDDLSRGALFAADRNLRSAARIYTDAARAWDDRISKPKKGTRK